MLSVIIVNFNTKNDLELCLYSLRQNLSITSEIIVVDNASQDGSQTLVRNVFSEVTLISLDKNIGFGAANNIGIQNSVGDIIWFLNSDTKILADPFKVLTFFDRNPRVGIIGTKLVLPSGETQNYICGDFHNLITPVLKLVPFRPHCWDSQEKCLVDWVTGASMFVRRRVTEKINGFDENFFMYFEDQDFCRRVKEEGFSVFYYPDYKVVHKCGASFKGNRKRAKKLYYQSMRYFFRKHRSPWQSFLINKLLSIWEKFNLQG